MNILIIINIFLFFILICLIYYFIIKTRNRIEEDNKTKIINNSLQEINASLISTQDKLNTDIILLQAEYDDAQTKLNNIDNLISQTEDRYEKLQQTAQTTLENQKKLSNDAFNNYWLVLENCYKEKEQEYDSNIETLKKNYEKEKAEIEADLDKIKQTRAAAIQASLREKEIKEQLAFYCLQVTPAELADIKKLEALKPQLNNPRVLSMLIWSTFFQKPMTALCNNIIGTTVKSGIYKITNQTNGMCYIGQAVKSADEKLFPIAVGGRLN